ncbi:uncharacterized protein [Panulirus ornatus]|uniref:uncharacterized protein n=1 Tax=Panulirus ornatus TaxID=150431 RepID=UPI003A87A27D
MALGSACHIALIFFLLLSDLMVDHPSHGEEVQVFSLQPDIWESPRDDVYIRFNMSNQQVATSLTQFTICSRVYLTGLTTLQVLLSYATADFFSNAIMMYIIDGSHFFRYNNKPQTAIERLEVGTVLRQWRHYCHVLSGDTYTVYVDGQALASGPIVVDDRRLPLNGTFVVGQEQDGLSRRFDSQQILKGFVTQVNIWSYGLSDAQVAKMATCQENMKGDVFSSDRDATELINVDEKTEPLQKLCQMHEDFLILPEGRTFADSLRMCHLLGSDMYAPLNREMTERVNKKFFTKKPCRKIHLWIGMTDKEEEGIWRRVSDEKIVTDIDWAPGQPDTSRVENCVIMSGRDALWNDYSCKKYQSCALCEEPLNLPLYLRGMCKERLTEIMFEVLDRFSNKPFFHGFYGLMIIQRKDRHWTMFDTVSNTTVAMLKVASDVSYPIGRHQWKLFSPVCERPVGSMLELSLSRCKEGKEYMCDDGQCIHVTARCDAKTDCDDETDEDNCSVLKVPAGYRSFKPPKNLEDPTQPLEPILVFKFLRFLKIEDVEETIKLEFIVSIKWKDSRLMFLSLRADTHDNKLSEDEADRLWKPMLRFPNVKDGVLQLLEENIYIQRMNLSLPADFNVVNMDVVHGGDAARIVYEQHYSGSFVCDFDVFSYPFDVQQCSVLIELSSVSHELVSLTTSKSTVEFEGDSTYGTYIIHEFFTRKLSGKKGGDLLEIGFTLTRRSTMTVMSIYLPSLMLIAIGYSTLFVQVQKLDVRSGVSLTTLLVLYTFFNQVSSSLPQTADVKMIDVWFFFCIILLFVIIIIHVVADCLDSRMTIRVNPTMRKPSRSLTAETLLQRIRMVGVPLVLLIFNLVYWGIFFSV